ncbi:Smr/MutS family protein [Acidisoma cellulosilytica]|uniref:Smr/MutS family protein n=1 Tax=Acidisoma cellulosilyticum TaxID=2802395 RepID=A0A963Z0Z3_9PROT|nr:Smr/MutS family protein [Acidisoma cellulosilyticum]MCB8880828.1 Smr/MutS family protein [Acidisoma cellulosilyticum]
MSPRRLSDKERNEWLHFAHVIGTKPLRPAQVRAMEEARAAAAKPDAPAVVPPPASPVIMRTAGRPAATWKIPEIEVGKLAGGLDGTSWNKLRRGQMRPERILDLHGRTVQPAFAAFERFILSARADGLRCVEIVTGRGAGEGGVLRRELPHWLNLPHIRSVILAAAHPHRANTGAVVLLLKRIR